MGAVPGTLTGTIPACAGSTRPDSRTSRPAWDHPRVRGEHVEQERRVVVLQGPSPRARGAHLGVTGDVEDPGTIPACAGSTRPPAALKRARRDHPRVRGEHGLAAQGDLPAAGPSPRARGAHSDSVAGRVAEGTIPACAGSTHSPVAGSWKARDHPRVRGEHNIAVSTENRDMGPSPRARGARTPNGRSKQTSGTIPACAGSTDNRSFLYHLDRDHPRVRGEHADFRSSTARWVGPSPRARGALLADFVVVDGDGTIPACAGSTPLPVRGS